MHIHIYLCVCMHIHMSILFYEKEIIPVAEAWGDDLVWQECQQYWIHPFQQQAEREANSYFVLKHIVTVTISEMCLFLEDKQTDF